MSAGLANRIVVHAGAPKTGSTYLQRRMRAAAGELRAAGVYLPVHPATTAMAGNAKLLATALAGQPTASFARVFPGIDVASLDPAEVAAELLSGWRRGEETLLLSAENLRSAQAARLAELLPTDAERCVVLFVRRQDEWIQSYFNQLTKTADIKLSFEDFLDSVMHGADIGERICRPDWDRHFAAWQAAFGDCRIVFYDEARRDLLGAFLAATGLPAMRDLPEIDPIQVSLDYSEFAWLLALDPSLPFAEFRAARDAAAAAARALGPAPRHSLLDAEAREAVAAHFASSNRALLEALGCPEKASLLAPLGDPPPFMALEDYRRTAGYASFETEARLQLQRRQS